MSDQSWLARRLMWIGVGGMLFTILVPAATTASGLITEIIDSTGDGTNILDRPRSVATDSAGNVYVAGFAEANAFKITPAGAITEIIDSTGDGTNILNRC